MDRSRVDHGFSVGGGGDVVGGVSDDLSDRAARTPASGAAEARVTVETGCAFCSIARGEMRRWTVYEDEAAVAFLDIGQATRGHTLVVPRVHASDIWEIAEEDAARTMRTVWRVAGILRDGLRPDGLNVTQSNGAAAGQEVFHYHVHLVPRYAGDGLVPPWRSTRPTDEVLSETLAQIRGSR